MKRMKRALLLSLIGCLVAVTALAEIDGAWTANADTKTDRIYVSLTRGRQNQNGNTYRLADLRGLTTAQIDAAARTDVKFEMGRDPGTIVFEGTFRNGRGAGQFTFTPNRGFAAALRGMRLDFDDWESKDSEEERLYFLASIGMSMDYIRAMEAEGFRGDFEQFVEMRLFGVTKEYIEEMRALGFRNLSREKLVESRIHGITPDYVRKARTYGWGNLSLDDLIETRIHGATPEFAEQMKKAGYPNLSREKLVEARIHGVTPKFIRELAEAGYEKVPFDKLVEMRIHGITADFIRKMEKVRK
jgi:hypothetical protein